MPGRKWFSTLLPPGHYVPAHGYRRSIFVGNDPGACRISAAEKELDLAPEDKALVETIWLLTQLILATRQGKIDAALRHAEINVSDSPGLMEIGGAVCDAVDRSLADNGS